MDAALTLNYEEGRLLIKDGDLISFIPTPGNFLHTLTQKVTKSDYYHSAIAVWLESDGGTRRLFVCEAHREGRRLVPMSMYKGSSFDVTVCPITYALIDGPMLDPVGGVPYGFFDFIAVGARMLFGVNISNGAGEICSEMVENMYDLGGMRMPKYIMSPGELKAYLNACGVVDRLYIRG